MVIKNDFEFQLVSADDKSPFKEHKSGLNTYVEVEPNAEYYLGVRRLKQGSKNSLYCKYRIDGKDLGYNLTWDQSTITFFYGITKFAKSGRSLYEKALRFVETSVTVGDDIDSTIAGIGKIEMEVYESIREVRVQSLDTDDDTNDTDDSDDNSSPFSIADPITVNSEAFVTKKKNLRSVVGSHRCLEMPENNKISEKGPYLYTITLYYCAAPGLIAVGALPKPPLWEHHRMRKRERLTADEKEELEKIVVVSIKRNRNGNEIIELGDSDTEIDHSVVI